MRIERFEDIKAWQEARALVNMVYNAVKTEKVFATDYRFKDQIQSAAVSAMSNISEGFSRRLGHDSLAKAGLSRVLSEFYIWFIGFFGLVTQAPRRSDKEFIQFLFIGKGSAAEVQSQLYVALDQNYISQKKFNELYAKADEVAKLISGLISYLLHSNDKPKQLDRPKRLNKPN